LSYPGRSEYNLSNASANAGEETFFGDELWNIEKSAEVIIPQEREGLNVRMAKET